MSSSLPLPLSISPSPDSAAPLARLVDFSRLAELAFDGGGRLWLEGVDEGPSGLTEADFHACGISWDLDASSFSFCVNGLTFTAMENPEDGYRSSLGVIIERSGNHCKNRFPAAALSFRMDGSFPEGAARDELLSVGSSADLISLTHPDLPHEILSVGTEDANDYYPSFSSYFSPELYTQALALFQAEEIERAASGAGASEPPRSRPSRI